MKNKLGFTLVELLTVISILGILMTVGSVSVFSILNRMQEELLEEQIKSLGDTAVTYVESQKKYIEKCPSDFDPKNWESATASQKKCFKKVTVSTLIDEGMFENKKDLCEIDKNIIVYRKDFGNYTELHSYIEEDTCSY